MKLKLKEGVCEEDPLDAEIRPYEALSLENHRRGIRDGDETEVTDCEVIPLKEVNGSYKDKDNNEYDDCAPDTRNNDVIKCKTVTKKGERKCYY